MMEFVFWLVYLIPVSLVRGFVTMKLWVWFIVPLGAPIITLSHALGISLMVGFLVLQSSSLKSSTTEERITQAVAMIFVPTFALCLGWIIHEIMVG